MQVLESFVPPSKHKQVADQLGHSQHTDLFQYTLSLCVNDMREIRPAHPFTHESSARLTMLESGKALGRNSLLQTYGKHAFLACN